MLTIINTIYFCDKSGLILVVGFIVLKKTKLPEVISLHSNVIFLLENVELVLSLWVFRTR